MEQCLSTRSYVTITIHFTALNEYIAARNIVIQGELKTCLECCLCRLSLWPTPRNWSHSAWRAETLHTVLNAAFEAAAEFDPQSGVVFLSFLHNRIMARSRTHYRREWKYGNRFVAETDQEDPDQRPEDKQNSERMVFNLAVHEENLRWALLEEALSALPHEQRRLVQQVFWEGQTEEELAKTSGITRRAVNKRKQAILQLLRKHFLSLK